MNVNQLIRKSVLVVSFLGMTTVPVLGHAIKPQPRVRVTGTVLLGSTVGFSGIATVDRRRVFQSIPAWRTIVAEKLSRNTARYHFLLKEANDAFRRALEQVAVDNGVDLVVDSGGVEATGLEVQDLTEAMERAVAPDGHGRSRR